MKLSVLKVFSTGMNKMEYKTKSKYGTTSNVYYVKNPFYIIVVYLDYKILDTVIGTKLPTLYKY